MRFNNDRTWGVEIEFIGNKEAVIRKMVELVSPPLAGEEGFRQLKFACQALNAANAKVNKNCGLHVHHVARDLPELVIRRFMKLYARYEGIIDTLVAPSRRNNTNGYCASLRTRLSSDADYQNLDNAVNLYAFNGTRYMKVNLESMSRHGTLEVRHHQGTTDFAKIKAWVVLTQALLNHCVDSRVGNNCKATWEQFKIVIGAVGAKFADETSRDAINFLNRRHRKFNHALGITARTVVEPMHAPMSEGTVR